MNLKFPDAVSLTGQQAPGIKGTASYVVGRYWKYELNSSCVCGKRTVPVELSLWPSEFFSCSFSSTHVTHIAEAPPLGIPQPLLDCLTQTHLSLLSWDRHILEDIGHTQQRLSSPS